ncbi:hypothetical protein DdX_20648 [Ditylenchus destructor]|uniref:Uncharacterized protein n=1 Tax=Ditylenchus destructor TaxID=166010 RepID=A0AAD4MG07_9BILA|nr:hypothetical protein DdX_20648 [Ditylenchus destructor]
MTVSFFSLTDMAARSMKPDGFPESGTLAEKENIVESSHTGTSCWNSTIPNRSNTYSWSMLARFFCMSLMCQRETNQPSTWNQSEQNTNEISVTQPGANQWK